MIIYNDFVLLSSEIAFISEPTTTYKHEFSVAQGLIFSVILFTCISFWSIIAFFIFGALNFKKLYKYTVYLRNGTSIERISTPDEYNNLRASM